MTNMIGSEGTSSEVNVQNHTEKDEEEKIVEEEEMTGLRGNKSFI